MDSLSPLRKAYYTYLARMYAFTHAAGNRSVLGMTLRGWLNLAGLVLLVVGWLGHWPGWLLAVMALIWVWLLLSFNRARHANYTRFVPDTTDLMGVSDLTPLAVNEKINGRATGGFSVSGYGENVLFRPAQYWQVPMGDHIVMVEQQPAKYLYQFFAATTLQSLAGGWLLFGREPQRALAISFMSKWGPEYTKFQAYEDGLEHSSPPKTVTIYLTFDDEAQFDRVAQTIVNDARRVRA